MLFYVQRITTYLAGV